MTRIAATRGRTICCITMRRLALLFRSSAKSPLPTVFAGCHADGSLENPRERLDVLVAASAGDVVQRLIRGQQEPLNVPDANRDDFVHHRVSQIAMKPPLQRAAGNVQRSQEVGEIDRLQGILPHLLNRFRDVGVLNRNHIRRSPRNHLRWRDDDLRRRRLFSPDQLVQQCCGFVSHLCGIRIDARQRRIGDLAFDRVVIDAKHGNLLGNGNPACIAGVQHLIRGCRCR